MCVCGSLFYYKVTIFEHLVFYLALKSSEILVKIEGQILVFFAMGLFFTTFEQEGYLYFLLLIVLPYSLEAHLIL
jgi:hypothetical protein